MNGRQCPKCGQQTISFLSFVSKFHLNKIKCQHCGVRLKGNKLLRAMFYCSLVFGSLLGLSIGYLENKYDWGFTKSVIIMFSIVAIIGTPVELITWKYAGFYLDDKTEEEK